MKWQKVIDPLGDEDNPLAAYRSGRWLISKGNIPSLRTNRLVWWVYRDMRQQGSYFLTLAEAKGYVEGHAAAFSP